MLGHVEMESYIGWPFFFYRRRGIVPVCRVSNVRKVALESVKDSIFGLSYILETTFVTGDQVYQVVELTCYFLRDYVSSPCAGACGKPAEVQFWTISAIF